MNPLNYHSVFRPPVCSRRYNCAAFYPMGAEIDYPRARVSPQAPRGWELDGGTFGNAPGIPHGPALARPIAGTPMGPAMSRPAAGVPGAVAARPGAPMGPRPGAPAAPHPMAARPGAPMAPLSVPMAPHPMAPRPGAPMAPYPPMAARLGAPMAPYPPMAARPGAPVAPYAGRPMPPMAGGGYGRIDRGDRGWDHHDHGWDHGWGSGHDPYWQGAAFYPQYVAPPIVVDDSGYYDDGSDDGYYDDGTDDDFGAESLADRTRAEFEKAEGFVKVHKSVIGATGLGLAGAYYGGLPGAAIGAGAGFLLSKLV